VSGSPSPRARHHDIAKIWFASLDRGEAGFCRIIQMGFLRLVSFNRWQARIKDLQPVDSGITMNGASL